MPMVSPKPHRWIHALLALLLLANGVLVAVQSAHYALEAEHPFGDSVLHHADSDGQDDNHHHAAHHVVAIDSGTDEHGHHFHVHLPAHALVSTASPFEYEAGADAEPSPAPLIPTSLTYAPPVPPPNA